MAIKRVSDLVPDLLADEMHRLYRLSPEWVRWQHTGEAAAEGRRTYRIEAACPTWTCGLWNSGCDGFGMWGLSAWIGGGPKIFRPTAVQCAALEQVEVRIELAQYAQPYPALLVDLSDLPGAPYAPFTAVLCHRPANMLSAQLFSADHRNDIVTTVAEDGHPMERSIERFDADCAETAPAATRALRVAVNACLALVNYGAHTEYLLPAEVTRDRRLAGSTGGRGARARTRLARAPRLVTFEQEVRLHRTEGGDRRDPTTADTGREVATHWRRGHWHTVAHGAGRALRKLVLYPPVLVRADRAVDGEGITTTYRG